MPLDRPQEIGGYDRNEAIGRMVRILTNLKRNDDVEILAVTHCVAFMHICGYRAGKEPVLEI